MKQFRDLYSIDQLPIFQNRMYDTEAEAIACPKGDVRLVEDLQTGLVYNASFRPEFMVYDEHYQNEQAVSPLFQEHLIYVAQIIKRSIGSDGIVEVGCGKGYFLELLLQKGVDVTGFDPAYEGINTRIERHYFEPSLGIKANGLILRNVLEHIQEPVDFLMSLKYANGGSGLIRKHF
ncbi:MAG: methyltransferase domain-containing protein [Chlorobiaceae bacterium]